MNLICTVEGSAYFSRCPNLGVGLINLKRPEDAHVSYDKAIALKPDFADAYNNGALKELKWLEDALASYDKATA